LRFWDFFEIFGIWDFFEILGFFWDFWDWWDFFEILGFLRFVGFFEIYGNFLRFFRKVIFLSDLPFAQYTMIYSHRLMFVEQPTDKKQGLTKHFVGKQFSFMHANLKLDHTWWGFLKINGFDFNVTWIIIKWICKHFDIIVLQ